MRNTLIHLRDQFQGNIEWLQELRMTKLYMEKKKCRIVNEMLFNFSNTLYNVQAITDRCYLEKDARKYRSSKVW